uniref:ATP synthase FO subunit 8 n=1 Tax=Ulva sp. TM637 TaxID=2496872 RepID=A0A7R6NFB1_9CHLO|nr:ATP synthase FO subunit 8 [Ulva sp. TM637]AZP40084.1 ATP synthase FO subunit 8 [Ulva sp. TM637]
MPQLDALTYFSQYVYLLITFSAVYYYVLYFIIPKIVSTLKIRQKLNSLTAQLRQAASYQNGVQQLRGDSDSSQLVGLFSQHYRGPTTNSTWLTESNNVGLQYNHLLNQAWLVNTSQANAVESVNQWLISTVALQLAHNLRLKKLLCDHIVRKITSN